MFNKLNLFLPFFILYCSSTLGQDCNFSIKGSSLDESTELPLSFVNIYIQEISRGTTSDVNGEFTMDSICTGEYHLIFSHIGCNPKKIHINLNQDTTIKILLPHSITSLGTLIVSGEGKNYNNDPNISVNRKKIEDNSNLNLASLLENESGVRLLKNGNGIAKPVIHGLYGNRLTILNNGILQSGQQWGNDHSPEIDPLSADKITIIKGANAIEYSGGNLGSVILLEPKRIGKEPHLHGQTNYTFESNGKGHSINSRLEKYSRWFAWRVNGTLKKYGDKKTPDYYLNNTGLEEYNLSVQLEKTWKEKFFLDFYASTFNTKLGILRGSHIGNITDLDQALLKDVPFFTDSSFSYNIDAPKQNVSHHLSKIKGKYLFNKNQKIEFIFANQINIRKEYDVRRAGRTENPSLSLFQNTFNSEIKYTHNLKNNWKIKLGNQNIISDNTNDPETGVMPLIPDYISYKSGIFSTFSKKKNKSNIYFGTRYDYEFQNVLTISNTLPREVIKYENQFNNLSLIFSLKRSLNKNSSLTFNSGYTTRNPAINELYSNGLHQGVSGIELGNINLNTEKALKNTIDYKWFPSTNFTLSVLGYQQLFKDYIFLNPQNDVRLTIRGAFPVFEYNQTNANIYGIDISSQYTVGKSLFGLIKYSYLKGMDIKNNVPLIFMPPNSLFSSLKYQIKNPLNIFKNLKSEETEIEFNNTLVFQQNNILIDQDFSPPPSSYNLLGLKFSTNLILLHNKIRFFTKVNNLFNAKYRDYLNRQRYFANDLGLSVIIGLNFKF